MLRARMSFHKPIVNSMKNNNFFLSVLFNWNGIEAKEDKQKEKIKRTERNMDINWG